MKKPISENPASSESTPILVAVVENDYTIPARLQTRIQLESLSRPLFKRIQVKQIQTLESADATTFDIEKLVSGIASLKPQLVILDVAILPSDVNDWKLTGGEPSGITILRQLATVIPNTPIVMFSNLVHDPLVNQMLVSIQNAKPQCRLERIQKDDPYWPRLVEVIGNLCNPYTCSQPLDAAVAEHPANAVSDDSSFLRRLSGKLSPWRRNR
jgi:hypothetical protein